MHVVVVVKRYLELRQISRSQLEYIFIKKMNRERERRSIDVMSMNINSIAVNSAKCEEIFWSNLFQFFFDEILSYFASFFL